MDSSIVALKERPGYFLVSTTDFFYPLVEDPYLQGRIACCNVLSDLYAVGVVNCDTMLMTLAASRDMEPAHRHIVTREMMRGFADMAREAHTRVTGGQTVLNPWPIIGGIAMAVVREEDMIRPWGAQAGNVLLLTKPLGTQLAVNAHQWMHMPPRWSDAETKSGVSREEAMRAYRLACANMSHLNRSAAALMHVHAATCCTDVTGFGILGHVENLARHQRRSDLRFVLERLPVLRSMLKLDALNPDTFKLAKGRSAETSGGLLIALPSLEHAKAYMSDLQLKSGQESWIVGHIELVAEPQVHSTALLLPNYQVVEV